LVNETNTSVIFCAENGSFAAEKRENECLNYFFDFWTKPKSQKNNSSIQKSFFAAVGGVIAPKNYRSIVRLNKI
jgi:hypothetical protein